MVSRAQVLVALRDHGVAASPLTIARIIGADNVAVAATLRTLYFMGKVKRLPYPTHPNRRYLYKSKKLA